MINLLITCLFLFLFVFVTPISQVNATENELPECVIITHCVKENYKVMLIK